MEQEWTRLLGIGEAARRLGVHINTLRRWVDSGAIEAVRLPSGYRRFQPAEIERKRREMGFTGEGGLAGPGSAPAEAGQQWPTRRSR